MKNFQWSNGFSPMISGICMGNCTIYCTIPCEVLWGIGFLSQVSMEEVYGGKPEVLRK